MRLLTDGDPVIVFGRTVELVGTGEVTLEPWDTSKLPAHRRAEATVHPDAVPLTGWPNDPVEFDAADPKLVWRVEGSWLDGTIAVSSRSLVQDPISRHFMLDVPDRSALPRRPQSPLDDHQQRELKRLQDIGDVLAIKIRRAANGKKVWVIVAFDPQRVAEALSLRPDQKALVEQAEWDAESVQRTREAFRSYWEQSPVLSFGQTNGVDGGPFAFTLRVAQPTPELLHLHEATPRGLLDVDVWLGPAADEREPEQGNRHADCGPS